MTYFVKNTDQTFMKGNTTSGTFVGKFQHKNNLYTLENISNVGITTVDCKM